MPKYAQAQIATTGVYDRSPSPTKPRLYGFFSDKRARTWTGPAKDAEVHPEVPPMPLGHNAQKSFLLAKSHVTLKRDRVTRKVKIR